MVDRFVFGRAATLYHRGLHPRLLWGPADIPRLRRQVRRGIGRQLMLALRRKAAPLIRQILDGEEWIELLRSGSFFWPKHEVSFMWALPDIALVGLVDEDTWALEAVCRVFRQFTSLSTGPDSVGLVSRSYYMPPLYVPFAYDLIAGHLEETSRRAFVRWAVKAFIHQVIHDRPHYLRSAAHNMTLGGMQLALVTLLAVQGDPGAPALDQSLRVLLRWLEATLNTAVGADGYPEEDIGYGTVVAPNLAQVVEPLRRAGAFDAYTVCPHFLNFGRAMLHMVQPWGEQLSNTGDHGDQLRDRQFVLARQASLCRDPALLWLLGTLTYAHSRTFPADPVPLQEIELPVKRGFSIPVSWLSLAVLDDLRRPVHPRRTRTPTAFRDRSRGLVSFRSGWDANATFVLFDGSQRCPAAPGHFHDSCGHFSLSALGEHFAIDTGRYNVEQDQHNLVLIDGKSGRSIHGQWVCDYHSGRLLDYQPDKFCDSAAADSSHQHHRIWARRWLGLVKGAAAPAYVWTVDDVNKNNDWAEYWWTLNTSPENTIRLRRATASVHGWRHGHALDVHFALPAPGCYPRPHRLSLIQDLATTSAHQYVADPAAVERMFTRPADMLHGPVVRRPRLIAKVQGYNGKIMAVMIPRRKATAPTRVRPIRCLDNTLALRLTFPKVEDILIFAFEHQLLEAADIRGRGRWCVVRRSRASGQVLDFALGDGASLEAAGQKLK